jgi:hypothetical protein
MFLSQTPDGAIRRFVWFRKIILPAVALGIIGALGFALFYPRDEPVWQTLAQPPSPITGIILYEHLTGRVYVMTESQQMYGCDATSCLLFQPRRDTLESSDDCQLTHFSTPAPTGQVSLDLSAYPCSPVATIEVHHVVLADGTLWRWAKWTSDADRAVTWSLALGGCVLGSASGLIGAAIMMWLSSRGIRGKARPLSRFLTR